MIGQTATNINLLLKHLLSVHKYFLVKENILPRQFVMNVYRQGGHQVTLRLLPVLGASYIIGITAAVLHHVTVTCNTKYIYTANAALIQNRTLQPI
jgi:hypothetical protein